MQVASTAPAAKTPRGAKAKSSPSVVRRASGAASPGKAPTRKAVAAEVRKATQPTSTQAIAKPVKVKLVRDSFSIPRAEYQTLQDLKDRLIRLTRPAKKSEVLRAGISLLATLDDAALLVVMAAVPAIKTGRPKRIK